MFQLNNKIAIVTGSGSGIGKAVALLFATQGATVHLLDLNETAASITLQLITKSNGKAFMHTGDVTDKSQVKEIFNKLSGIDILINSAGISHVGNLENTSGEDMDRLYNVNVKGVYNCMQAAISIMKKNKSGIILNLASIANNVGIADRFAYSMTKGAVYAMTLSVAKDYIGEGIRCNCISPARKKKRCLKNYLKASPLAEWQSRKKLPTLFYFYVLMKLLL